MAITLPYNITAGTSADATQVEANFNELESKATDKTGDTLTGSLLTRALIPTADATYDLGSASFQFKNLYLSGSIIGPGAVNAFGIIAVSGETNVVADASADTLTLVKGTGINLALTPASDSVTITNTGKTDIGSSAIDGQVGGTIYNYQNSTGVGNVGAGEDTLYSQAVAAAVLATDGDSIAFELVGTFAANANTKRVRVKFGSTTFLDSGAAALNSKVWSVTGNVTRLGATSQLVNAVIVVGDPSTLGTPSVLSVLTTAAETLSGAVTFAVTGEATSDNDIVLKLVRLAVSPDNPNN